MLVNLCVAMQSGKDSFEFEVSPIAWFRCLLAKTTGEGITWVVLILFFLINFVYYYFKMNINSNRISWHSFISDYLRILNFQTMLKNLSTVFLLLFGLFQSLNAQQTVKGTILDEKGNPIIAVNVILKGSGTGVYCGSFDMLIPNFWVIFAKGWSAWFEN